MYMYVVKTEVQKQTDIKSEWNVCFCLVMLIYCSMWHTWVCKLFDYGITVSIVGHKSVLYKTDISFLNVIGVVLTCYAVSNVSEMICLFMCACLMTFIQDSSFHFTNKLVITGTLMFVCFFTEIGLLTAL